MKKSYFWSLLVVLMIALTSMVCISCGDDDEDNGNGPTESLSVNGLNEATLLFNGSFDGKSGIDFKQSVNVASTASWVANGVPDWLSVSPLNGNGNVTISIYPKNENETATPRTASIILTCSNVSAIINVTQEAGKPVCYVEPDNLIALYDCICWEYSATSNTNEFQWILLSENEANRMTEREILAEISETEKMKYEKDNWLSVTGRDSHGNRINSNSAYFFITLAYDKDGKSGELRKTLIKTPISRDDDKDAWVRFDNVSCGYSVGFRFDAIKDGLSDSYHIIYGISDEYYNDAIYAFEINYYINNHKKHWLAKNEYWEWEIQTSYPNNHQFTYYTDQLSIFPISFAYGWGVFKDGTLSSRIKGFQWDTSNANVKKMGKVCTATEELNNIVIKRSDIFCKK